MLVAVGRAMFVSGTVGLFLCFLRGLAEQLLTRRRAAMAVNTKIFVILISSVRESLVTHTHLVQCSTTVQSPTIYILLVNTQTVVFATH